MIEATASSSSRRSRKTRSISSSMVAHEHPERLVARLLGREVRVHAVRGEHRVHAPRDLAELRGVLEEVLRRARARSPQPSRPSATNVCRTPSVADRRSPSNAYQPASGAMFAKPCSVRKRSISSSGFSPGSRRRKTFSARASSSTIVELGLLGAHRPDRRRLGQRRRLARPGELHVPLGGVDRRPRHHQVRDHRGGRRVAERVVLAARAGDHLVEIVDAGVEARLDQRARQPVAQRDQVEHAHVRDVRRLGAEPAARAQPLAEVVLVDGAEISHAARPPA